MSRIAGVVLAAGAGRRMGRPKAELELAGERLVDRAVRVLRDAGCDPVLAVVRAGVEVPGTRVVVNPEPERGMRSSLELGLGAVASAGSGGVDAVAVLLVDLPGVGSDAVRATLAAWTPGRIAVARFGPRRGHPIVMAPRLWADAIAGADPDAGAKAYLRAHSDLVDEVPVDGDARDLDTPEDVADWTRDG